jgi:hypothetical protein
MVVRDDVGIWYFECGIGADLAYARRRATDQLHALARQREGQPPVRAGAVAWPTFALRTASVLARSRCLCRQVPLRLI